MAQAAEQPALDHEDGLLDLGLVARPARPRRQDRGAVMRRHFRIGAICGSYRQALMTATLVLSGTSSAGTPPIAAKAPAWPLIQSASPCVQVACA